MSTTPHRRLPVLPLTALVLLSPAGTSAAAVLPYADPLAPPASIRAGLIAPVASEIAGQWVGRMPDGRLIAVTLRVDAGAIEGDAALEGAVPEAGGRQPLVTATMTGRSVSFAVQPGPRAKALAHGVLTVVSKRAAHLSLYAGPTPISVQLSRVG